MRRWIRIGLFLLAVVMAGCQSDREEGAGPDDRVLARVHNKSLLLSDLEGMIPDGTTPQDSMIIINAFVERWVREAVLMHEAELNVPKDLNIDKLVRDYRASLIKHNYEVMLVERLLDSVVTRNELMAFYERNKEQFELDEPIIRCHFLKVSMEVPQLDKLKGLWKKKEKTGVMDELREFADTFATVHLLNDSLWLPLSAVTQEIPEAWIGEKDLSSGFSLSRQDDNFHYLFSLMDVVPAKEIPPLAYVEDKARRVILHQRKQKLLEEKKEEMYDRELRQNNIWINPEK